MRLGRESERSIFVDIASMEALTSPVEQMKDTQKQKKEKRYNKKIGKEKPQNW